MSINALVNPSISVSDKAINSSDHVIDIQNLSLTFNTSDGPVFALLGLQAVVKPHC